MPYCPRCGAEAPRAKSVVDDFCEAVNLDGINLLVARETVASGFEP